MAQSFQRHRNHTRHSLRCIPDTHCDVYQTLTAMYTRHSLRFRDTNRSFPTTQRFFNCKEILFGVMNTLKASILGTGEGTGRVKATPGGLKGQLPGSTIHWHAMVLPQRDPVQRPWWSQKTSSALGDGPTMPGKVETHRNYAFSEKENSFIIG